MSRLSPSKPKPFAALLLKLSRRQVGQMTGSAPEGAIGPLEAYARFPSLLFTYGMFETGTGRLHTVPERLKALAQLKAATILHCEYCIDIGSQLARRAGISDEELLALPRYRESELFDERERVVLDYAVAMSRTPVEVPDELFASLQRHFDDRQVVELTNVTALENMRSRFNLSLGYGAAGFTEGMVCAVPEPATAAAEHDTAPAAASG
jgi:AhpD family alkylhydroperoxidase